MATNNNTASDSSFARANQRLDTGWTQSLYWRQPRRKITVLRIKNTRVSRGAGRLCIPAGPRDGDANKGPRAVCLERKSDTTRGRRQATEREAAAPTSQNNPV